MIVRKVIKREIEVVGLGARLKNAQAGSSYSVRSLAAALKISPKYWYLLVNETEDLAWDLLKRIEAVLGVDFGVDL
jgi:plasmid maintenance system antidote protein VapI